MSAVGHDLAYASATELRRILDAGTASVEEVIDAVARRIEAVEPHLNALVARRLDAARADARTADGIPLGDRGPLHGVPITIKDLNTTLELPTSFGSRAFAGTTTTSAADEAVVASRLRRAGAILVAKTNAPELGLRPTTENALFGATANPWALDRSPGGSSGGAAAACAAGFGPLHLGNDGGGSCRIPASCCGVVGMKPSRGLVPWAPALYECWAGLGSNGPITRTVRDAALMLDGIAGPVLGDPYAAPTYPSSFLEACDRPPVSLRIAATAVHAHEGMDPQVLAAFTASLEVFEQLGHDVIDAGPDLANVAEPFLAIVAANTAVTVRRIALDRDEEPFELFEPSTLAAYARGLELSAADYAEAVTVARREAARIMGFWEDVDVLLTPTLTQLPPMSDALPARRDFRGRWDEYMDWLGFTYPFNVTGQPALSIPCGWSAEGLPIGLQLVGRIGSDDLLLALAAAFEEARPWHDRRPPLA